MLCGLNCSQHRKNCAGCRPSAKKRGGKCANFWRLAEKATHRLGYWTTYKKSRGEIMIERSRPMPYPPITGTMEAVQATAAKNRAEAIKRATEAWNNAPMTIKAMGAQFVLPMLSAMGAMALELDALQAAMQQKGGDHGGA